MKSNTKKAIAGNKLQGKKKIERNEDHDSPGVLTGIQDEEQTPREEISTSTYQTRNRSIEDVQIIIIQRFPLIPYYVDPMDAEYPYVVRTPSGVYCMDGLDKIEEERSKGRDTITCDVESIDNHSIEELVLRKIASRTKTRGGQAIFPEIVRNTCTAAEMLVNSDKNLILFFHGGRRHGKDFSEQRDNNVRQILATRLGYDRDTVNTHLLYGRYITGAAFDTLINLRVKKIVFEKFQTKKTKLEARLEKERLPVSEIALKISAELLVFVGEYGRQRSETVTAPNQQCVELPQDALSEASVEINEPACNGEEEDDEEPVSHAQETDVTVNAEANDEMDARSLPGVKKAIIVTVRRIEAVTANETDISGIINCLRKEMINLQIILHRLNCFQKEGIAA